MEYFAYSQKAFVYKYVVMLSDIDQFKHTSFANYLKLMFLATDALLVSCLNADFLANRRLGLVNSKLQFKRQTKVGDNILIKINSSNINDCEFSLLYTFAIEGSGELVALGRQVYTLLSRETDSPEQISDNIKTLLDPINVDENHLLYKY